MELVVWKQQSCQGPLFIRKNNNSDEDDLAGYDQTNGDGYYECVRILVTVC